MKKLPFTHRPTSSDLCDLAREIIKTGRAGGRSAQELADDIVNDAFHDWPALLMEGNAMGVKIKNAVTIHSRVGERPQKLTGVIIKSGDGMSYQVELLLSDRTRWKGVCHTNQGDLVTDLKRLDQ
jgi:hypothetical protein